jgi:deoxyribodipyrimidine photo-lyase
MTSQAQRFCGELAEQGLYLERLLVLDAAGGRDPQPLTAFKSAPPDAHKCAAVLEAAERGAPVAGQYVLYLMTVQRRTQDNAGLAVASAFSKALRKPLLVVEAMSGNAPWSSARVHSFIGESAASTAAHFSGYLFVPQGHDPLVDPEKNVSARIASHLQPEEAFTTGLLSSPEKVANAAVVPSLFDNASLVVCDWAPFYIFPDIALRAQRTLEKRNPQASFVLVDDVGLVPLFKHPKAEAAARFIRPKLQAYIAAAERERRGVEKLISERLVFSERLPLQGELLLGDVVGQTNSDAREYAHAMCEFAQVSSSVPAVKNIMGGESAALQQLERFLQRDLSRYGEERNHPNESCSSKLSPWLHFGMIHPRTVLSRVSETMGVAQAVELHSDSSAAKFVDELVTWRELGQNMAHFAYRNGVALGSPALVPTWAWDTLKKFTPPAVKQVSLEKLEAAESPDPVWNAAQKELLKTGVIHNYMRMLWGKGIVRWSNGPEEALQRLEYLNNKYSIDGRDPNSYTGIYWCMGKFDRPWPPAREPFGLVRSMTTASAQKKLRMDKYLKTW